VQPLQKFIKYLLIGITLCFAVWATPRSIIATVSEVRAMGGSAHPVLGYLGVMSAKNTAVNILILTTFMSFLLYRRTGKIATVRWARIGHAVQLAIFAAAASSSWGSTGTSSRRRCGSGSRCRRSARS
jgi:cytochrome bd ubiquinol oxidase subunit I